MSYKLILTDNEGTVIDSLYELDHYDLGLSESGRSSAYETLQALTGPLRATLDTESSASRQHLIDTGYYLTKEETREQQEQS